MPFSFSNVGCYGNERLFMIGAFGLPRGLSCSFPSHELLTPADALHIVQVRIGWTIYCLGKMGGGGGVVSLEDRVALG